MDRLKETRLYIKPLGVLVVLDELFYLSPLECLLFFSITLQGLLEEEEIFIWEQCIDSLPDKIFIYASFLGLDFEGTVITLLFLGYSELLKKISLELCEFFKPLLLLVLGLRLALFSFLFKFGPNLLFDYTAL